MYRPWFSSTNFPNAPFREKLIDMQWLELTVQTHPEAVESVSELLNRYARGGVAIEEPIELIDEGQEDRVLTGQPVNVHAYLPIDGKEEEARQQIAEGLWHLSSLDRNLSVIYKRASYMRKTVPM